jgi:hypothetical protein
MQDPSLVLRDIHQPPAPPWWPPAPGWWLLAALLLLAVAAALWWLHRRRRRREVIVKLFDDAVAKAVTPAAEVAAMSELLRRAARRVDPAADRLQGEAWLAFLDRESGAIGKSRPARPATNEFTEGPGRLLLDGGYRAEVDASEVAALRPLVRARFLQWMAAR